MLFLPVFIYLLSLCAPICSPFKLAIKIIKLLVRTMTFDYLLPGSDATQVSDYLCCARYLQIRLTVFCGLSGYETSLIDVRVLLLADIKFSTRQWQHAIVGCVLWLVDFSMSTNDQPMTTCDAPIPSIVCFQIAWNLTLNKHAWGEAVSVCQQHGAAVRLESET